MTTLALGLSIGRVLPSLTPNDLTARQTVGSTKANAPLPSQPRSLDQLIALPEAEFEALDVIELNLAIARQIPECRNLDVAKYRSAVDDWARWVKHEVDRHAYQFERNPAEYKNSRGYFNALMMRTVIDQDFGVTYTREQFSFNQPLDLFVHGVIDQRRGTCISLPVLQIAIGQRLGWPIRPVAVPGHTFCRWDDRRTGERFNIEAATRKGFIDHDDEYYRHWPFEIDPRWEREHNVLNSLTMRQYASVMVSALGAYYTALSDLPAAIRWDAYSSWLDPANRSSFVSLRLGMDHRLPIYLDADELAGRKKYWELKPHPDVVPQLTSESSSRYEPLVKPVATGGRADNKE